MEADKDVADVATQGILTSEDPEGSASEEPYSIYSRNDKWFIVGIVAVAGFYRYVFQPQHAAVLAPHEILVPCRPISTSRQFLQWQKRFRPRKKLSIRQ